MTTTTASTIIGDDNNDNEKDNNGNNNNEDNNNKLIERKIALATEGFYYDYMNNRLKNIERKENIKTICNYLIAMNAEINPNIMYKKNQMQILCFLSEFHNNKK